MNKTALRIKMLANNDTGITLSKALNMSETTLSAKINGTTSKIEVLVDTTSPDIEIEKNGGKQADAA